MESSGPPTGKPKPQPNSNGIRKAVLYGVQRKRRLSQLSVSGVGVLKTGPPGGPRIRTAKHHKFITSCGDHSEAPAAHIANKSRLHFGVPPHSVSPTWEATRGAMSRPFRMHSGAMPCLVGDLAHRGPNALRLRPARRSLNFNVTNGPRRKSREKVATPWSIKFLCPETSSRRSLFKARLGTKFGTLIFAREQKTNSNKASPSARTLKALPIQNHVVHNPSLHCPLSRAALPSPLYPAAGRSQFHLPRTF